MTAYQERKATLAVMHDAVESGRTDMLPALRATLPSRDWNHEVVSGGISLGEDFSSTRRVVMINATCRRFHDHAFVLWFGACGGARLHVYADSLEHAIEECGDWLAEHAPGLITRPGSDEYQDLMRETCEELGLAWPMPAPEALPEGVTEDQYWDAEDQAFSDHTRLEAGWIPSWEWGIALEDPTVEELYAYVKGE
jgi:hypothetical protein